MPGANGNVPSARHNGTWKDWSNVLGRLNGTWRQATDVFVRRNGSWVKVWIQLTAPTGVTTSAPGTTTSVTVSWTNGEGAEGHRIYRSLGGTDTLVGTVTGATNTFSTTLPLRYTSYTFKVESYAGAQSSTRVSSSNSVSATVATPTSITSSVTPWRYTATDDWINENMGATISWGAVDGANEYRIYRAGNQIATVASTATSYTLSTNERNVTISLTVAAVNTDNGTNLSAQSTAKSFSIGQPRLRSNTSGVVTGEAQTSASGTTNGQFNYRFRGDLFNTWVYQVKWTLDVDWSGGYYVTNYPGRRIRLTYPGATFEVPDDQPNGYNRTIAISGQDVTVGVDPYGTGWSSSGSGTIGTFHVNVNLRVYYTFVTQNETANSTS